jgi:hypothetical protein
LRPSESPHFDFFTVICGGDPNTLFANRGGPALSGTRSRGSASAALSNTRRRRRGSARCSFAISAADWLPRAPTDLSIPRLVAYAMSLGASSFAPPRVRLHALKAENSSPTPGCCCQHVRPQAALQLCVADARCGHAPPPVRVSRADAHAQDPRCACSATPEPEERTAGALCHASIQARRSPPFRGRRGPILSRCANTTRF